MNRRFSTVLIISSALILSACTNTQGEAKYPTGYDRTETGGDIYAKRQSIMGDHGFCFGGSDQKAHMSEGAPEVFAKARIPLSAAIKRAEEATQGRAFSAEINRDSNQALYFVKLLRNGKVIHVAVNAKTGAVVKP